MTTIQSEIERIAAEPACDKYLDRDPATLTQADIVALIAVLRSERTQFQTREQTGNAGAELGEAWDDA